MRGAMPSAVSERGDLSQPVLVWRSAGAVIVVHAIFWTLSGALYSLGRAVHPDMLEIYALGRELAFGYTRHPPLVAWITAGWFEVLPQSNATYFLLAALTSAIGLAGIAALAQRLVPSKSSAHTAVVLHALLPFHGLMALVFNHNTVQLALWPWTAYWLLRAIDTRSLLAGLLLGILAALCVLAKYYAAVLFVSLLLATALHPKGLRFLGSATCLLALAVGAAVLAPHIFWLVGQTTTPFDHAIAQTSREWSITVREAAIVTVFVLAAHLLVLAVLAAAIGWQRVCTLPSALLATPERRAIAALAFAPLAVTLLIGFTGLAKISIVFTTPCFFLTPVAILAVLSTAELDRLTGIASRTALLSAPFILIVLTAFPFAVMSNGSSKAWEAKPQVAAAAISAWRAATTGQPDLVAGMAGYSDAIGFYAAPKAAIMRSFRNQADADEASRRLATYGGMVVCESQQSDCLDAMSKLQLAGAIRHEINVTPNLLWVSGPQVHVTLLMVPSPNR